MTSYGTETQITFLDTNGSTLEIIEQIQDTTIQRRLKRVCLRIRVTDKKQEMMEYLKFSDEIEALRQAHTLAFIKRDPTTRPSFSIEYPADTNIDGAYFVIRSYTALIV